MDLRWVDTHSHLDRYETAERAAILSRAAEASVAVIAVGVDVDSSAAALECPDVVGVAVGIHPLHATGADLRALLGLASHQRVIAIGECGFDSAGPPFDLQATVFAAQTRTARALDLPLVLHVDGTGAFEQLTRHANLLAGVTVIRHYFTGDAAQAAWHAERGHYLSFGNPLRRDSGLRDIARTYPAAQLLVETDSYPVAGRRTEPSDVARVAETLALVRGWTFSEASTQLLENTRAAFPRLTL